MKSNMEDFWDFLCSTLEILEDKEKKDIIREYGRRIAKEEHERIEKNLRDAIKHGDLREGNMDNCIENIFNYNKEL